MRNLDEMPQEAQELYRKYKQALEDRNKLTDERIKNFELERLVFWKSVTLPRDIVPNWLMNYIVLQQEKPIEKGSFTISFNVPGIQKLSLKTYYSDGKFLCDYIPMPWMYWHSGYWRCYSTIDEAIYWSVTL